MSIQKYLEKKDSNLLPPLPKEKQLSYKNIKLNDPKFISIPISKELKHYYDSNHGNLVVNNKGKILLKKLK